MAGRRIKRGVALLGLAVLGGCHGGIALQSIVLLVTLGIFVGTILLNRS